MKELIRRVLWTLNLDITRNLKYDRLTLKAMKKVLQTNSNCIDVGAHKGEILDWMIKLSPAGKHIAFEPIPAFYKNLVVKYPEHITIRQVALSNETGISSFNYVKNAPAYSGLKQRSYAVNNPEIEKIEVEKNTLDYELKEEKPIRLIKIDVEGAEFEVLKGAVNTIRKSKPFILFEFGLGAADHYGTNPEELFNFMQDCKMEIYTLKSFVDGNASLSKNQFKELYNNNSEYYFIAGPKNESQ
jgi:FkbM family methyltransferase